VGVGLSVRTAGRGLNADLVSDLPCPELACWLMFASVDVDTDWCQALMGCALGHPDSERGER